VAVGVEGFRESGGAGCRRAMAGRSKDDFSLDSPFIEQVIGADAQLAYSSCKACA
jgi:hypothetical protein